MFYVEILIAAAAAFALGFLWYTALFGKYWQSQTGITNEQAQKNMGVTHGLAFLAMAACAYFMQSAWGGHFNDDPSFTHGAYHAARYGSIFAIPAMIINYAYQKRSLGLFLVDAAYIIAIITLMGALLSVITMYESPIPTLEEAMERVDYINGYLEEAQQKVEELKNTGGGE